MTRRRPTPRGGKPATKETARKHAVDRTGVAGGTAKGSLAAWTIVVALVAFGAVYGLTKWSQERNGSDDNADAPATIAEQREHPPTRTETAPPAAEAPPGMVWIPGGEFLMGSDDAEARPDERPVHRTAVDGFWIDATEVTNAQFRAFVEESGYVTTAEKTPAIEEIMAQTPPGTPPPPPGMLVPGSLVFSPPAESVPLDDIGRWWRWQAGANWRHPEGPHSNLDGRDDHPVVQVSWFDAAAYAAWAGKRLPTEAEWERAARGGLEQRPYVWGDAPVSDDRPQANVWQGEFPVSNLAADGYDRTAPVGSFPANGFGLYDMAGNVWEWCADWYRPDAYALLPRRRVAMNPQGPATSLHPGQPYGPQRVQRGGSYLCNPSYCSSYRPGARMGTSPDSGMSHLGFRCATTPELWRLRGAKGR